MSIKTPYSVKDIAISGSNIPATCTPPQAEFQAIAAQAQAMIARLIAEGKLPPELANSSLKLCVQGDRFKVLDASGKIIIDTDSTASLQAQEISTIAKKILQKPATPPAAAEPAAKLQATPALKSIVEPHPIANPQWYCFANSAYQLLGTIPKLRKIACSIKPSLQPLADYSNIPDGRTLINIWNKEVPPKEQFATRNGHLTTGHMASEFLERVLGECSNVPQAILTSEHTRKNPKQYDKQSTQSAPSNIIGINTKTPGAAIDFNKALALSMEYTTDPAQVKDEDVIHSRSYFEENPELLFVRINRFDAGKKDERPVNNIPMILNTTRLVKKGTPPSQLELKGFIVHSGSGLGQCGGHYTAYMKIEDSKAPGTYHWVHADDGAPIRVVSEKELKEALQFASDLYYDNDLTTPRQESKPSAPQQPQNTSLERLNKALHYLDNKADFIATETADNDLTYNDFLSWTFNTLISKSARDAIAKAVGERKKSSLAFWKTAQDYGYSTIQKNLEEPHFKQLLKAAVHRQKTALLVAGIK